ncbi:hypothetical protein M0R45_018018 [Rubus argutus]|uniref:Uncharacterized protein n=1 Tax=Rubus argutus TaxID=59490 RepID=A0AAW1XZR9_RUBAR
MATTENKYYVQPAIPRFDGHYDHWSMLMENFLRSKEYWTLVETGYEEPEAGAAVSDVQQRRLDEQRLKDLKVKNYLFQAIDRTILETILQKNTSKQIWDSMKKKYKGSAKVKRSQLQALRRDFEILQMKQGESVIDYFSKTMAIANKMRLHGDTMTDVTIVEKILRSMTSKFDYVVCSIEESNDIDQMSIDELQSSLLVHEQKLNRSSSTTSEEQALKASTFAESSSSRGRGRGRDRGRGRGGRGNRDGSRQQLSFKNEYHSQSRGRGRDHYFDKSNIECFRCHKIGHYRSECNVKLPFDKEKGEKSNFVEKKEEQETLLMAFHVKENKHEPDIWYLDTGCSNHMFGRKSFFSNLNEDFRTTVSFGDHSTVSVMGKGDVQIRTKEDNIETISNVFYIPELKSNLLSVGQLQEKGYIATIKGGACEIYDPRRGVIAHVKMTPNRLFPLQIKSANTCFVTTVTDPTWLWHFRYGHLNFSGLKTLSQKNMVTGLPQIIPPIKICEECVVGKQHREQFPKGKAWRAQRPLELIHSDICGPINPTSNGEKRYFISFIDDYSRKAWVYFLQNKSEAFRAFKSFKALVEKEAGRSIKTLRTDRGGEFMSQEFANFCAEHGIRRQLTAAYTPQQNGVSERKNRTILNMVRSMLAKGKIPKSFWPEAVNWSIHILNRSPTFAVQNMTPEEAWSGKKPAVDHFKIFGCIAYAHIPDEKRKKLDDKGEKCVFLGVSEQSKAYKLFNPITKKIVVSRDVIFDEESTWNWSEKATRQQQIPVSFDEDTEEQQPIIFTNNMPSHQPLQEVQASGTSSRPQRTTRKRPAWMIDYVSGDDLSDDDNDALVHFALFADCDPVVFEDAVKDKKWQKAMDAEIKSIEKNDTWELINLPKGEKTIGVKWVYKTKLNEKGEVEKYKARLVAKGYKQEYGVDYKEVFAPVARMDTVRLIISMAAQNSWPIYQLDVKSAFLHGELEEEVYIDQPPGYVKQGHENQVYRLKKALYGLKQAPRAWYSRIDAYFAKEGFLKCPYEHTLYTKFGDDGKILFVCLYVDDLIFTSNDRVMFDDFKKSMTDEFDMSDLGLMHYFLGIEVMQASEGVFIS